jgi:hypothetical protein
MTALPRMPDPVVAPPVRSEPGTRAHPMAAARIRRCTFRRLIAVDRVAGRVYDVDCLYPDRAVPLPLGDLGSAMPICNACTASHTFRADED